MAYQKTGRPRGRPPKVLQARKVAPEQRRVHLIERLMASELAAKELIPFTKLMMPDPDDVDDVNRSRYQAAKHHKVIAATIEEMANGNAAYRRVIIKLPPRHGKTELASKKHIAWYAGKFPERSVIFGTYNDKYACDVGRAVRDIIRSPAYQQVFPDVELKTGSAAVDRLETTKDGILAFIGREGTTTGRGGDLLVLDDPIKSATEARSLTIRDHVWEWYTRTISSRMMTDTACILIIATQWHEDDPIGRLTDPTNDYYDVDEAKRWKVIDLPALALDDDPLGRKPGEALWPERFSRQWLLERQQLDPSGFSALYQGRPTPAGGAFFKAEWLQTYKPTQLPKNLRCYIASDHAVSAAQNRDKTCLIPVGVDNNDDIYVLPDVWWRHADTGATVDAMLTLIKRWRPLFWWAERSHISRSIGPFLRKRMLEENAHCAMCEIIPIADKQTRAQSIQGRMSMKKVFFPERTSWWPEARDQIVRFPGGQHDDFVDALAYIGLGLNFQVGASVINAPKPQRASPGTFGHLIQTSDQRRRLSGVARLTAGW